MVSSPVHGVLAALQIAVLRPMLVLLALALVWMPLPCPAAESAPTEKPAGTAPSSNPDGSSGSGAAPAAKPAEISDELRVQLEAPINDKVQKILDEKDADSQQFKRATFSRYFREIDDSTYQTSFSQDTVTKDALTVERFTLTLKKDPAKGNWEVTSQELVDTYKNLYRSIPGDEEFFSFDTFSIGREGMTIKASKGTLYKDTRLGKVERFVLAADDITYDYQPPESKHQALFKKLKKEKASDVIFKPEYVYFDCDPVSCADILDSSFKGIAPTTLDKTSAVLQERYNKWLKDAKKARKDEPFRGFRRPPDPDRRNYTMGVVKGDIDHMLFLDYDNWGQKEVMFGAWGLDKRFPYPSSLYWYYSEATLKSGINPYDIERRDDAEARDYDLVGLDGTVELGVADPEEMKADISFKLKTKRELREVPYFIVRLKQSESEKKESKNPQLIINSVQDGEGHELTWVKLGSAAGLVVLPKPLPAGTPLTLHMQFTNMASIHNFNSTFSYVDRSGWLPFVRFTDMISDFRLVLKSLPSKQILGIGEKISDKVVGDVRVTEWVAANPVEFPSVTFGEYTTVESKVEAKKLDGTKIPVVIHVDKTGVSVFEGIRMRDFFGMTGGAMQYLADKAANSINFYRELYGQDYPYAKLDLVNDPIGSFYGQSPSSLVYLGEGTFAGQGTAAELGGADLTKFNREVVPHEVAHQWWGSLIPNFNDGNYWFVESLSEYSSALFVEFESGKDDREAYQEKVASWRRLVLDTDLQASVQDASVVTAGSDPQRAYTAAVYNKGPYAFHIMRMTWGDEKFFKFLKMLAAEFKHKAIVTRDIQKVAEKAFGGNMDFFFDQWIRGIGAPEYTFNYSVRPTEDGKFLVEGKIDQRVLVGTTKELVEGSYFTAIVPITIVDIKGKEYRYPIRVEGPSKDFKFKINEKPKEITLNKYGESFAYDVIVKQGS